MALMMSAAGMHHYPNCISFASADSRPQRLKICTVERLKIEFGSGQLGNVLDGLNAMSDGIDSGIYASLIQECIKAKDLSTGMRIHEQIVQRGMEGNVYLGNLLLSLYGKCGSLDKALQTFNAMPCRNVVSWSAMISAYGKHGQPKKAVGLLNEMECEGLKPNRITMITVLNALSTSELLNSVSKMQEQYSKEWNIKT